MDSPTCWGCGATNPNKTSASPSATLRTGSVEPFGTPVNKTDFKLDYRDGVELQLRAMLPNLHHSIV